MARRVVVIGGGAAGLMAAGRAGELGAEVLLLEKMSQPGNKLRLTGNGRCNLTHWGESAELIAHLGSHGSFLRNGLARFSPAGLRSFLAVHGVPTVVEADGRVFPASHEARDVAEALQKYCLQQGVTVRTQQRVGGLLAHAGAIVGVQCDGEGLIEAERVILATGGLSYPQTGSTGDGYWLAGQVGHTIIPLRPALVGLVVAEECCGGLQGVSLADVQVTAYQGERKLASVVGEILFTHYGLSGPAILNLSLYLAEALVAGAVRLALDLKPDLDPPALDRKLRLDLRPSHKESYHTLLKGFLPRALLDFLFERNGLRERPLSQLTVAERQRLVRSIKSLELTVLRTRPVREAMVTQGGVSVSEIDPQTMGSRLVRGLYLAGEVIDVAGETGGYNLQAAFTTGRIAGEGAARMSR